MDYYMLYVGDREHATSDRFKADVVPVQVMRLDIGDYCIMDNNKGNLRAVFERKTYNDQCASILDGRHDNYKKMLDMRTQSGCDVYYILERDNYTGSIAFDTMINSVYTLMVRHNIRVMLSNGIDDTVDILTRLYGVYSKGPLLQQSVSTGDMSKDICTKRVVLDMWSQIPGISKHTAILFASKYKLIDYLRSSPEFASSVATLRYSSGNALPGAIRMRLMSPPDYDKINVLSACRGVSKVGAKELCEAINWNDATADTIAQFKVGNRKLGKYGMHLYDVITRIVAN